MFFDDAVRDTISAYMGFSCHDLSTEDLTKIVRDKPLNLIYFITGKGVASFPIDIPKDTTSAKLARILNIILIEHFDNVPEFLDTLGADYDFIQDIWTNDIRKPKYRMINKLVKLWGVDPIYLYGAQKMQITQRKMEVA